MYFKKVFAKLNFFKVFKSFKRFFSILDKNLLSESLKGNILRVVISIFMSLPVLTFFLFSLVNSFNLETAKIINSRVSQIEVIENLVHEKLTSIVNIASSMAINETFIDFVQNQNWQEALEQKKNSVYEFDFIDSIFLTDINGTITAGSNEGFSEVIGKNYAASDWYLGVVKSGKPYISNIYKRDNVPQINVFTVAVPIKDFKQLPAENKINNKGSNKDNDKNSDSNNKDSEHSNLLTKDIGILAIQFKPEIISEWLKNISIYQNQIIYIVDKNNKLVIHPAYNTEKELIDFSNQPEIQKIKNIKKGVDFVKDFSTGKKYLLVFEKCTTHDWVIITKQLENTAFIERTKNLYFNLVVNFVIFCFTFAVIYLIFKFALNNRKSWLLERRLSSYIENTSDAIISIDLNGNITFFNRGAEIIFGYKFNEVVGKSLSILLPFKLRDNFSSFLEMLTNMPLKKSLKSVQSKTARIQLLNKNGKILILLLSVSPLYNADKNIIELTLIGKDLTSQIKNIEYIEKLNKMLLVKTKGLENLNKELEAFSYSVAHDLRAPLRSISGFGQALLEDNFNQLDKQGKDYLNRIKNAAKKMSDIINDLLKLSFVSRKSIVKKKINLSSLCLKIINDLVEIIKNDYEIKKYEITKQKINENEINSEYGQIYKDYKDQINIHIEALHKIKDKEKSTDFLNSDYKENKENNIARKINVKILNNVTAYGDEELIEIMLFNLLDNAFKFTSKKIYSLIEFGVIIKDSKNNKKDKIYKNSKKDKQKIISKSKIYFIKDNGVGFDMRYIEKLFNPFQRLHSEKDFPGTGIGLSIIKRIVSRHDGNVWAESYPDVYTVFYFTLSKNFK